MSHGKLHWDFKRALCRKDMVHLFDHLNAKGKSLHVTFRPLGERGGGIDILDRVTLTPLGKRVKFPFLLLSWPSIPLDNPMKPFVEHANKRMERVPMWSLSGAHAHVSFLVFETTSTPWTFEERDIIYTAFESLECIRKVTCKT